jgi:LPPG:FO 2-phospho-L-lactate transferase
MLITALAGGVGAARFLSGLVKVVNEEEINIIANTGDDIELFGLHISPDIDIVTYTLAGIVDEEKGWGIKDDTFKCLEMFKELGVDSWFMLGDKDLATHIYRTNRMRLGTSLSQVTSEVCQALGLKVKILPMTDNRFETRIRTKEGWMHFEEYFVKNQAREEVLDVKFEGVGTAKPSLQVLESILDSEIVVICPSNPIVSIGTILSIAGIRDALKRTGARIVAISPIVAGATIKGPADKMMRGLGHEVSAYGVSNLYADFLDTIIIDYKDAAQKNRIERLGIDVKISNTVMRNLDDKISLAKLVIEN